MASGKMKTWAVIEANAASNSFKLRSLPQGSNYLKPKPCPSIASSSNLYTCVTKDQQLPSLSFPSQVRTVAPCNQKQLDRPINVLDFSDLEEGEIIVEVEPDSKCKEMDEAGRFEKLRNYSDIAYTSGKVRIDVSLTKAECSNQVSSSPEYPDKRLKLDPVFLNENIDTFNDWDVNTVAEANNLVVTIDPVGTQSMSIKEEMVGREKSNEKLSISKSHLTRRKRRLQTKKLSRENSELVQELKLLGEQCQIMGDENTALLDELEQAFGRDAVSDLRDLHSTLNNNQSNGDGKSGSHEDN